ncbi:MAG: SCO family protein [Gammaproteobacteria bacterium]|nr:SCO family protein [Gammaproteobacteria bacterium]
MKLPLTIITVVAIVLGVISSIVYLKPEPLRLQALTWFGAQAKSLPAFELTDHNGRPFNNKTLEGQWDLLFFGYTHCPDICPDSLQMLNNMVSQIDDPKLLKKLRISFISIDPERDDLDQLKTYVTYFNKHFISARADIDELKPLTSALGILHTIDKSADAETYDVSHSGTFILIDPQGRYTGVFSPPHDSAKLAHDVSGIINY